MTSMAERSRQDVAVMRAHALQPVGRRDEGEMPPCYRVRRPVEPTPKRPSRLVYLPPVRTRAGFWLPLGCVAAPRSGESPRTDPYDDFAA